MPPALCTAASNATCRSDLLLAIDAALRETAGLLAAAAERNHDVRGLSFRQVWLREALGRFLVGDDTGAQDMLDEVRLPQAAEEAKL